METSDRFRFPGVFAIVEDLESSLGDPRDPGNPFSFQSSVLLDEQEAPHTAAFERLNAWGFNRYFLPPELGGKLVHFDEFIMLGRAASRRDLSVAIDYGVSFLGFSPLWVSGSRPAQEAAARHILAGRRVAFGLTEEAHGSDLLNCEVFAEKTADGFVLSGRKWLINNATRGGGISIFARTSPSGGLDGFSVLFVDKDKVDADRFAHVPKIRTLGIRGVDISGIQFDGCKLDEQSLAGKLGSGLETALKSLQVTRALCSGFSLGAADTALRLTLDFARRRELYRATALDLPNVRATVVNGLLDLLIAECVTLSGVRSLQTCTEQMSVRSAVLKYFVPVTCEQLTRDLAIALGARYYVREGHAWGTYQKLTRDMPVVSLFDGSTVVNLSLIAKQLHSIVCYTGDARASIAARARLKSTFDLNVRPLPFDPGRLNLYNNGREDVAQEIPRLSRHLQGLDDVEPVVRERLDRALAALAEEWTWFGETVRALRDKDPQGHSASPEMFELAGRFCRLYAASACVLIWAHNRPHFGGFFRGGQWLVACVERLLSSFRPRELGIPYQDEILAEALALLDEDRLFSLVPVRLASPRA